MGVESLGFFRADGRPKGCYVYMVLCPAEAEMHVKVGISNEPIERFRAIQNNCSLTADTLATVWMPMRNMARDMESMLHREFAPWRCNGEWFIVPVASKREFNAGWKKAFQWYGSPANPLAWTKMDARQLMADARRARRGWSAVAVKSGIDVRGLRA